MTRWEYKIVRPFVLSLWSNRERRLAELGQEGWELVAVRVGPIWYLKRPVKA
jgi:hypothetical protein